MRRLSAIILLPLLLLAACAGDSDEPTWIEGAPLEQDPTLPPPVFSLRYSSVTLQRGYCFGTCPAYRVTIDGTGHVTWEGEAYVAVPGTAEADVDVAPYIELLKEIIEARFLEADSVYDHQPALLVRPDGTCEMGLAIVADSPSQTITVRLGLYSKTVVDTYGAPQEIHALGGLIDEAAGTARWIGGESR